MEYERGFWRDPEALEAAYREVGTMADLAVVAGTTQKTLLDWWRRHGLPPLPKGERSKMPRPEQLATAENDSWLLDALKKVKDRASVSELADVADVAPRRVREALERLGEAGYRVSHEDEAVQLERVPTETGERHTARPELFEGDLFRFAVVSDTHLGSKAERVDALVTAYEVIAREGVTTVYHPGDLVDGLGIYRTQNTEVNLHTYEDQVEHACEVYPVVEGVTTYIVSGNHDLEGDFGKAGADPVQAVANRRPDFAYLGRYSAYVDLPNGASLHLLHPMGGGAYAVSWRPQKIAESFEGGAKPNVVLIGHYHTAGWFPIRGIQMLLGGTFQGPTTYSVRKAMGSPGWGFYIVTCRLAEDGSIVRFQPEFYPFYLSR